MRRVRKLVNFLIMITFPIWAVPVFLLLLIGGGLIGFMEVYNQSQEGRGEKWFWE
jgi:cytochrome c-type biogenesis protein CcmH/NrfF